jgi:hypothetical protein
MNFITYAWVTFATSLITSSEHRKVIVLSSDSFSSVPCIKYMMALTVRVQTSAAKRITDVLDASHLSSMRKHEDSRFIRAKQKSNKFSSIWHQPTVFVFSPNPTNHTDRKFWHKKEKSIQY